MNALSPGPIATRAASGIPHFDALLHHVLQKSPINEPISIQSVGAYAQFLVSDDARLITGSTVYIDAGFNIMAV